MFSDDDSMPHLKAEPKATQRTLGKQQSPCLQKIKQLVCLTRPVHTITEALQGKHSHEVQSVRVQILPVQ